jgi:hypothetical protein
MDAEVDVASAMGRSSKLKAPTGTDEDIEPSGKKSHARKAGQSGRQEGFGPPNTKVHTNIRYHFLRRLK